MKKILTSKYEWKAIFLWSLAPVLAMLVFLRLSTFFRFSDDWLIPFLFLPFLIWGIIAGLSWGDNKEYFQKFTLFKSIFRILFFAVIASTAVFSVFFTLADPIENIGFMRNVLRTAGVLAPFVVIALTVPILVGFVPAIVVNLIGNFFKK